MRIILYLMLTAGLLVSCKTNQLYLNVIEPAPVTLSKSVRTAGVINRSMPTDETKGLDKIEKILSLEGVDLDKDGALQCIIGMTDELLNNRRFDAVENLSDVDFRTPKTLSFPEPLKWDIVDMICSENKVDILFSLEYYDTDAHINYSTGKADVKTALGIVIPALGHIADMETIVKTGWRIYEPADRKISDEFNHIQSVVYSGRGINPVVAVEGLTKRKEAVQEVSNQAGHGYAMRLLPAELQVVRDYFVKGTNNFKIAKRKARLGKWDEAGLLWEKETKNPRMKVAGRACYNMGIISEINGDVDTALKWTQKAYEDYNIKPALRYSRILENRLYNREILDQQQAQ